MNQSDAYYRALLAYRGMVSAQRECLRDRNTFIAAEGRGAVSVTRAVCTVDEAWINAIEAGLVHIEKAIKEERQFIYSNGEVIPIEKVKQVSKDSVAHLARHSGLITRVQEGEDLIPDQLYTVERLSDYAVYENRFLYMLLCYLRDFVTLRYQKILDLTNRYNGRLSVEREINGFGRTVELSIDLKETRRDDPYLREHNPARELIDRMDLILKTILAFLATPLMESAGKVAMLKPPITKTNVLKMDNNFKGAVALYDYIISYEGDGYTVTEDVHTIDPFGDELSEDMAEAELLLSFLTYRYGLDLGAELKASMERDENLRRMAEIKKRTDKLEALRRRMERDGVAPEEYILDLEKQVRTLQHEADRLGPLYGEIEERKASQALLSDTVEGLNGQVEAMAEEAHRAEMAHAEAMREADQKHEEEKSALCARHGEAMAAEREAHACELTAREEQAEAERARHREELDALNVKLAEGRSEADRLQEALEAQKAENQLLRARLLGKQAMEGQVSSEELEAMTDRESFDSLEQELEAFVGLYEKVWKQTKKKIRKDLINLKYIKGQSGKQ